MSPHIINLFMSGIARHIIILLSLLFERQQIYELYLIKYKIVDNYRNIKVCNYIVDILPILRYTI